MGSEMADRPLPLESGFDEAKLQPNTVKLFANILDLSDKIAEVRAGRQLIAKRDLTLHAKRLDNGGLRFRGDYVLELIGP